MSKRKTNPAEDPQFAAESQHNEGASHTDPRKVRDPNRGVPDRDGTTFVTKGGIRPATNTDQNTVGQMNDATTEGGGLALDGGKLAGNKDDFGGDLVKRGRTKPGADSDNAVTPAHDLPTGDSGKTDNPD